MAPRRTLPEPDARDDGRRLRLLGGFHLAAAGQELQLPLGSQRLLAFLALQPQSRDRGWVAAQLWTDHSEKRAQANLRSALWRIRRSGVDPVRASGPQLALDPDLAVDLASFAELIRLALDGGLEFPLSAALDLLTSELLPEWSDDWVISERERIRQQGLHALDALGLTLTAERRFGEAVDVALTAVSMEPDRESSQRTLIAAHIAEGNYSEALRQYVRYREHLRQELGVLPSPRMQLLIREIGYRDEAA